NGTHTHTADPPCYVLNASGPGVWVPGRAAGVALSRKGAKSRIGGRKLRSAGTKDRARGAPARRSQSPLVTKLKAHARDLERKLREALEQQTATSEVLGVISSSPGELQPVFQTILQNAARLCEAKFGTLYLCEGDALRIVAAYNVPPAFAEMRSR